MNDAGESKGVRKNGNWLNPVLCTGPPRIRQVIAGLQKTFLLALLQCRVNSQDDSHITNRRLGAKTERARPGMSRRFTVCCHLCDFLYFVQNETR